MNRWQFLRAGAMTALGATGLVRSVSRVARPVVPETPALQGLTLETSPDCVRWRPYAAVSAPVIGLGEVRLLLGLAESVALEDDPAHRYRRLRAGVDAHWSA